MLHRLYARVIEIAAGPHALAALLIVSFVESSDIGISLPTEAKESMPARSRSIAGMKSLASRRPHDASFFERVMRRTCVLNSTICVFERLICQGIPLVIWWPDNRPF